MLDGSFGYHPISLIVKISEFHADVVVWLFQFLTPLLYKTFQMFSQLTVMSIQLKQCVEKFSNKQDAKTLISEIISESKRLRISSFLFCRACSLASLNLIPTMAFGSRIPEG